MNFSLLSYTSALVLLISCNSSGEKAEKKDNAEIVSSTAEVPHADTVVYQNPETKII